MPWARLLKEWAIYAAIMTVAFLIFFRDGNILPILAGLVVSGPLYLLLGWVLAKFGYQRQTLRGGRDARAAAAAERAGAPGDAGGSDELPRPGRPRPAGRRPGRTARRAPSGGEQRP